ncbi:MAG: transporter related [Anaerocolumna sp.]|nr:transporter related [Anaerocolumna sp.]
MLLLNGVTKYYKKNKAVDNITFEVKKGEIFGLIGQNGAGKSTTITMIATMLKPDSGDILFHGESIIKKPNIIRKHLGYVPQDIALYSSLSGKDNLIFWANAYHVPKDICDSRIFEIRNIIGFTKEMLENKVYTYSGGMKRRLNIGVALLHHPELVIMDEPTVGIDISARNQILSAMKELNDSGTTIIYSGHYMEEIERICSSICILNKGKEVINGNLKYLLSNSNGNKSLEQFYFEQIGSVNS